jgi:hypothetical protein
VHKYDLTPDCTHLIVGDYNTPKYRHVAKERPDVKPMAAGWVEAVRNLWVQDAEIDFVALEREWQLRTFETGGGEPMPDGTVSRRRNLLCCMTGFEDPDLRQQITQNIESNGGVYTGDLTRRVTHLIVHKPEGRKYQAAQNWEVRTVSVEWVFDSIERGMILDEKCYDPVLPKEERGVGAWNRQKPRRVSSLGKRLRESSALQEDGKRKLRKTASMKLNSQRDNLWGDILGKSPAQDIGPVSLLKDAPAKAATLPPTPSAQQSGGLKSMDTQGSKLSSFGGPDPNAIFDSCCFFVYGFSSQKAEILMNVIASLGGLICHSLDEVVSTSGAQLAHRFLIVPQASSPDTHPQIPDNVHIITEFYIERCLHKKYFFDPSQHVIGRPFPAFPIPGFEDLVICTAGFAGVDLNQVDKAIRQLGGKYVERFTADVSILVCHSLAATRKDKLEFARAWKIPVVSAEWLWECISTGFRVPIKRFLFPELKQNITSPKQSRAKAKDSTNGHDDKPPARGLADQNPVPKPTVKPTPRPDSDDASTRPKGSGEPGRAEGGPYEHESNFTTTTHFATALSHQFHTSNAEGTGSSSKTSTAAPLLEASANALNKSPSSSSRKAPGPDQQQPPARKGLSRIASEVADSEATEGDVCRPEDIPADDIDNDVENQPDDYSAGRAAVEQEEKEEQARLDAAAAAEGQRQQQQLEAEKAEAERLAISTKLASSLLDSNTGAAGGNTLLLPTSTTTAAPVVGSATVSDATAPQVAPPADDSTPAAATARPKRRKREILGRAVSNVSVASAASSASAGDSAAAGCTTPATTTGRPVDGGEAVMPTTTPVQEVGEARPPVPASTQLEYEDPEAKRYKAQLMSKMLGKDKGASFSFPQQQQQQEAEEEGHKLTLAEMGLMMQQQQRFFDEASSAKERRATRRR